MADPAATGRRYYQSSKAPAALPVPTHHSHLTRAAALQDEPQLMHTTTGPGTSDEEVSITMDDAAAQEESVVEEESQDPHFAMSFEYEETFRAHKAASISEAFEVVLKTCYQWTIYGVYHFIVLVTGLCVVLFWATLNGLTIYAQSWCISPITRYILVCLQGVFLPVYELLKSTMRGINGLMGTLTKGCCKKRS